VSSLLEIKNLKVHFKTEYGVVRAVDGVDLAVDSGRTIGIVGESGCGKSVTALAIMGLIQEPGRVVDGEILLYKNGRVIPLHELPPKGKQMRSIRGNEIAIIFQEPMTSFNPVFTIGHQIMETVMLHQNLGRREARQRSVEMLRLVGIPLAERRVDDYPHQLSGGMCQRAMIAMALSCRPALLIADEPTTALDVTIQAQVLELMIGLKNELNTSIMIITHDLGVVAGMADDIAVMYLGRIVEKSEARRVFRDPGHPYTRGLLESTPSIIEKVSSLKPIKGMVPEPYYLPRGCAFQPRCSTATARCETESPPLVEVAPGHFVACWLQTKRGR
jgi:oligopeptide/dipeptide ABC transporter ATP-binding protein